MKNLLSTILFFASLVLHAQPYTDAGYVRAFERIVTMLESDSTGDLKAAVFAVENAFLDEQLDENTFNETLTNHARLAEAWLVTNHLQGYSGVDSLHFARSGAVFKLMTDTIFLMPGIPLSLPFRYEAEDFFGARDWTNMFVTKLLATRSGNCHSMPILYKLMCDELGVKAHLALAPNHLYIKQRSKALGWYNTELTSAAFPLDSWLMASGYISTDALRSGIWMDTLGTRRSLALCLVDLAQGYQRKYPGLNDGFVEDCVELALAQDEHFIPALLLRADVLKQRYQHKQDPAVLEQLNALAGLLVKLDYRDIPKEVYLRWLEDLSTHKERYANPALNTNFTH